MDLLQKILDCSEEDIDTIVEQAIEEADSNSDKIEKLGFLNCGIANNLFKGFIPLNTRIKYSKFSMEDYGMQTTDYMYEFAHFIKQYNINSKASLIQNLENFINSYFGMPDKGDREQIFNDVAWSKTTTDEEYFAALENNKLEDLKHKGAAQCTERSALAQQILSLLGVESYYCMGCLDLGEHQEGHCFNIVKRKNDYAILDYSCPVTVYSKDGAVQAYYPFVGTLSDEEFLEFANNGTIKSFENYEFVEGKRSTTGERLYVVGAYEIDKKKIKTGSELGREVIAEIEDIQLVDNTEKYISAQQKQLQNQKDANNQTL
ncbi:MAG: hypothetical protein IJN50_06830 [Clostridia bacterium]|nr:hypothetical protein [Clostridia bacterium]